MAYSEKDKQAFRDKDMRITRCAAFNNMVALRVAEVELTKDKERLTFQSIVEEIESDVFNYLWSGTKPDSSNASGDVPKSKGKGGSKKGKTKKVAENTLPEPNDKQAGVLDEICKEYGCDVEKLKAALVDVFGMYPSNLASISKIAEKINLNSLKS